MSIPKGERPSKEKNLAICIKAFKYIQQEKFKEAMREFKEVDDDLLTLEERKNVFTQYVYCLIMLDKGQTFCSVMDATGYKYLLNDMKLGLEIVLFAQGKGIYCPLLKCKFLKNLGEEKKDEAIEILLEIINRKDCNCEMVIKASFNLAEIYGTRRLFIEERDIYAKALFGLNNTFEGIPPNNTMFYAQELRDKIENTNQKIVEKERSKYFDIHW